jgi:polyhydroxyalkanoate synthase
VDSRCFAISWRNPDARHAEWDLSTYTSAIIEALDAIERICRVHQTVITGACSGGILTSLVAERLAALGASARLAGIALAVTVLDFQRAGLPAALGDRYLAAAATALSRRRGYLDGRLLAEVFAWLRPGDLVWHYWVNNYLLGRKPPAFDVLFWNADTTRMTAALHAGFIEVAQRGMPDGLAAIDVDSYVIAGITDHITPWQSCYRTTQLIGGTSRFVLSSSGHIAALVNPPGNPKAGFRAAQADQPDPQDWLRDAPAATGSWWPRLRRLARRALRATQEGAAASWRRRPDSARRGARHIRFRQLRKSLCTKASADRLAPTTFTSATSSPRRSATTGAAPETSSTARCSP